MHCTYRVNKYPSRGKSKWWRFHWLLCVCWGAYFTYLLTYFIFDTNQTSLPADESTSALCSCHIRPKILFHVLLVWIRKKTNIGNVYQISPHTPAPNSWPITGRRQAVFARGGDLTSISLFFFFFPSNVTDSENDQDDIYPCRRVHAHCVVYNALHNCSTVNFL